MTDSPSKKAEKRPFKAPKLEIYGLARDITRNVGNTGNTDGGANPNGKTRA